MFDEEKAKDFGKMVNLQYVDVFKGCPTCGEPNGSGSSICSRCNNSLVRNYGMLKAKLKNNMFKTVTGEIVEMTDNGIITIDPRSLFKKEDIDLVDDKVIRILEDETPAPDRIYILSSHHPETADIVRTLQLHGWQINEDFFVTKQENPTWEDLEREIKDAIDDNFKATEIVMDKVLDDSELTDKTIVNWTEIRQYQDGQKEETFEGTYKNFLERMSTVGEAFEGKSEDGLTETYVLSSIEKFSRILVPKSVEKSATREVLSVGFEGPIPEEFLEKKCNKLCRNSLCEDYFIQAICRKQGIALPLNTSITLLNSTSPIWRVDPNYEQVYYKHIYSKTLSSILEDAVLDEKSKQRVFRDYFSKIFTKQELVILDEAIQNKKILDTRRFHSTILKIDDISLANRDAAVLDYYTLCCGIRLQQASTFIVEFPNKISCVFSEPQTLGLNHIKNIELFKMDPERFLKILDNIPNGTSLFFDQYPELFLEEDVPPHEFEYEAPIRNPLYTENETLRAITCTEEYSDIIRAINLAHNELDKFMCTKKLILEASPSTDVKSMRHMTEKYANKCFDVVKLFKSSVLNNLSKDEINLLLGKTISEKYDYIEKSLKLILEKDPFVNIEACKFFGIEVPEEPKEVPENSDITEELKEIKEEKETLFDRISSFKKDLAKKIKGIDKEQKEPEKSIKDLFQKNTGEAK